MDRHALDNLVFLVLLVALAAGVARGLWLRRRERAMWGAWAVARGWTHAPGGLFEPQRVADPAGDVEVAVELRGSRSQRTRYTRCTARIPARLPDGFGLAPRGVLDRVVDAVRGPGVRSGDAAVDDVAVLYGDPAQVRALFRAPGMGEAARGVVDADARIVDGCVTLAVLGAMGSEQDLDALVDRTQELARGVAAAATGAATG